MPDFKEWRTIIREQLGVGSFLVTAGLCALVVMYGYLGAASVETIVRWCIVFLVIGFVTSLVPNPIDYEIGKRLFPHATPDQQGYGWLLFLVIYLSTIALSVALAIWIID